MINSRERKELQVYERHPFVLPLEKIYQCLNTNKDTGLDDVKVQAAHRKYELNKLNGDGGVQWYTVLVKQVSNAMILVGQHKSSFQKRTLTD